jgi:23S rRNA (guanine745-N1)-methyltransferase
MQVSRAVVDVAGNVGTWKVMLVCPVRNCRLELVREDRLLRCPRGHSFDVARSGYVNLLQPQERRSKEPGDAAKAVEARRRLHDRGVSGPLLSEIEKMLAARAGDQVLDAGCGDGFYLGTLAARHAFAGHGVDISIAAVNAAAKRYPHCEWIVANADRLIPYADGSFTRVMTITARRNAAEFRRVLRAGGRLLVAVPAPDDLIELRGRGKDRVDLVRQEFAAGFQLMEQRRATSVVDLDKTAVEDVLASIYRPLRATPVQAMTVTFSLDLLAFEPV